MRETVNDEAIYRWHPMFAQDGFEVWYHGADAAPATIEGGDILVIGNGAVLAGMSERTTPQAVEMLAHRLSRPGRARCLVAIDMPKPGRSCTWDTVMTMCDYGCSPSTWAWACCGPTRWSRGPAPRAEGHRPSAGGHAHRDRGRIGAAQHQGADGQPGRAGRAAGAVGRRLQRAGHRAGVVVAYDRNVTTNSYLEQNGVEVVTVPGSELGRGRGGPRCMSCPIEREA